MIRVLSVNKLRGKVIDYTCVENSKERHINKDEIVKLIHENKVENVRLQVYQGRNIVRYKNDVIVNNLVTVPDTPKKEPKKVIKEATSKTPSQAPEKTPKEVANKKEMVIIECDKKEPKIDKQEEVERGLFARIFGIGSKEETNTGFGLFEEMDNSTKTHLKVIGK